MNISKIKSAIESGLSGKASEYWHGTTEKNDYIIIAQREGVDAAISELEEMAATFVDADKIIFRIDFSEPTGSVGYAEAFGGTPRFYRSESDAKLAAAKLSQTGDWGKSGPPEYYVTQSTVGDCESVHGFDLESVQ